MPESRRFTSYQGTVTVEVDGQVFEGRPLTLDQAEPLFLAGEGDGRKLTRLLTAATFGIDEATLGKMPWAWYSQLAQLQVEINGLKPVGSGEGEAKAATAESTSA